MKGHLGAVKAVAQSAILIFPEGLNCRGVLCYLESEVSGFEKVVKLD